MDRRAYLLASVAGPLSVMLTGERLRADAAPGDTLGSLRVVDLKLKGKRDLSRRALVLLPPGNPKRLRTLVLLHGLGETKSEALGINAWRQRYGLESCHGRLRRPPLTRSMPKLPYLPRDWLERANRALERRGYRGMAFVCPFMPNPHASGDPQGLIVRYADWIEGELLPTLREKTGLSAEPPNTGIDGCSLGGYVATEVYLRKPELFGSFGCVQSAIGSWRARGYAERFAAIFEHLPRRPLHILTSSDDPYRAACQALSRELSRHKVQNDFELLPGPHNQPWLREAGTLAMLLWHDRHLGS